MYAVQHRLTYAVAGGSPAFSDLMSQTGIAMPIGPRLLEDTRAKLSMSGIPVETCTALLAGLLHGMAQCLYSHMCAAGCPSARWPLTESQAQRAHRMIIKIIC